MLTTQEYLSYNDVMKPVATVVIPVSPAHEQVMYRAIESVRAQSVRTSFHFVIDQDGRGAGWARNTGARAVKTPFVIFLDADDTLEPRFVEHTLWTYQRGRYVYTGWYAGEQVRLPAAKNPFAGEGFHIVTTLMPTAAFRAVGGFDETLPGHEDTDLHLKLAAAGVCGVLSPLPLVRYTPDGERSKRFRARADYLHIRKQVFVRNGGERTVMCCGQPDAPGEALPMGNHFEGDVQARTLWTGTRSESSWFNESRVYRGGNGAVIWVDPRDIQAQPRLFQRVYPIADISPDKADSLREAGLL